MGDLQTTDRGLKQRLPEPRERYRAHNADSLVCCFADCQSAGAKTGVPTGINELPALGTKLPQLGPRRLATGETAGRAACATSSGHSLNCYMSMFDPIAVGFSMGGDKALLPLGVALSNRSVHVIQ